MTGYREVPIEPGLVERVAAGLRYAVTGDTSAYNIWFGPGAPPLPQQPEVGGRQYDYPTQTNLQWQPRVGEPVGYQTLRDLADGYDLLRLVIETRKDQLAKLEWTIKPRAPKAKPDARCADIEAFLQCPDKVHNWDQWNRMFWEEVLVPDAPAILPRRTMGGQPYALDIIDGTTIKPVVGVDGRRPLTGPAFQQVIKGIPVANFTVQDLYYRPHNPRAHKLYGYSKVEQVITTVNIALRRQLSQLQYYTEGSAPDMIFSTPPEWNLDAIKKFAEWWWSQLSHGNTAQRRKGMFVPHGVEPINTKDMLLKDAYDEWLARIICYCFSVPPQALVKEQNRATAGTQKDMSKEEGLLPLMKYQKGVMDDILRDFFGAPDLQFDWKQEAATSPLEQAQIDKSDVEAGIRTVNEVRTERGLENLPEEPTPEPTATEGLPTGEKPQDTALNGQQITALLGVVQAKVPRNTAAAVIGASFPSLSQAQVSAMVAGMPEKPEAEPTPPPAGKDPAAQGQASGLPPAPASTDEPTPKAGEPATKLAKLRSGELKKKALKPIKRDRPVVLKLEAKVRKTVIKFLKAQVQPIAKMLHGVLPESAEKLEKMSREEAQALLDELGLDWHELGDDLESVLAAIAQDGAAQALAQIGVSSASIVDQVNEKAVAWAEEHAATLVKGLEETTLKSLRGDLAASIELGMSVDEIAAVLEKDYAFSEARAELIATTERAFADVEGNMTAYRESGVVSGKEWVLGSEHDDALECDCSDNAEAGVIPLDETFPGGDDAPPNHPGCVCDVLPVVAEDETA